MKTLLSVDALGKSYQGTKVLEDYHLTVEAGTVLGIMGPSGCGKSTLLRLIAGLESPGTGEIRLNDTVISRPGVVLPPQQRKMGMVFQHLALWPHLTIFQHLEYGLTQITKPERNARIDAMLQGLKITDLAGRYPCQLSGGEQQRVSLGRALITRPLILLCDEPFSSLDQELKEEVRAFFYQTVRQEKITAIFVSHDPADLTQADRVETMAKKTQLY